MNRELDTLTRDLTAFESFQAMLDTAPTYRPTLLPRYGRSYLDLADAYDAAQAARGDARRAYRGNWTPPTADPSPEGLLSVACAGVPGGSGLYSEWLRVIHAINALSAAEGDGQTIGSPERTYNRPDHSYVEEYPDFRVILRLTEWGCQNNTGVIQAKTTSGEYRLRRVVEHLYAE